MTDRIEYPEGTAPCPSCDGAGGFGAKGVCGECEGSGTNADPRHPDTLREPPIDGDNNKA